MGGDKRTVCQTLTVSHDRRALTGNNSFEETIKEDINFIKNSPWIKKDTRLIGLKLDIETGLLHEVQDLKP